MLWTSRRAATLVLATFALAAAPAGGQAQRGRGVPVTSAAARDLLAFRLMAYAEARKADLPFDLVDAVMKIESGYHPEQVGGVGEIGLMQVRPETAAMMGFRGAPAALADPATNIHFGTTYLGQAWHLAHGDVCRTLMKYRAGHGEEAMSALSSTYCARAKAHLVSINSPLAALIKPSDLVASVAAPTSSAGARLPRGGSRFWVAFRAKIKAANARIEAKWKRVAAR